MIRWWVVWLGKKDNQFHACLGYSEQAATKTAHVMMEPSLITMVTPYETIELRRPDDLVHMLGCIGGELSRSPDKPNPLNYARQSWALQASSKGKAIYICQTEWKKNQLTGDANV